MNEQFASMARLFGWFLVGGGRCCPAFGFTFVLLVYLLTMIGVSI